MTPFIDCYSMGGRRMISRLLGEVCSMLRLLFLPRFRSSLGSGGGEFFCRFL